MSSLPLYDKPKVGGDILSWCSKCKMELAHVVVAMLGSAPIKVLCKTCKSQHRYRRMGATGSSVRVPSTRSPGAPKARLPSRGSARWEERLSQTHGKDPVPYNGRQTFALGDVLNHANFGVGIVEEVKRNGKILVLFREGEKVLIHARPG